MHNNTKKKYIHKIYEELVQLYQEDTGGMIFPFDKKSFFVEDYDEDEELNLNPLDDEDDRP